MAEKWNKKWDGKIYEHRNLKKRINNARKAIPAEVHEHDRRREEDSEYRREWEKWKKKVARKRDKKKAKREGKALRVKHKAGVFDVVVPEGEDGHRHCPRCDGMNFTKPRLHSEKF